MDWNATGFFRLSVLPNALGSASRNFSLERRYRKVSVCGIYRLRPPAIGARYIGRSGRRLANRSSQEAIALSPADESARRIKLESQHSGASEGRSKHEYPSPSFHLRERRPRNDHARHLTK
jgi:hypothetical protein